MTYKEAIQQVNDNLGLLNPQMINTVPPHLVLGSLIAPAGTPLTELGDIYHRLVDNKEMNDEVLIDKKMYSSELIVYVVYKMQGSFWFQPLDSYKIKPFFLSDGNAS
jgi:hypothetical protein